MRRPSHAGVFVLVALSLAAPAFAQQDERQRENAEQVAGILAALGAHGRAPDQTRPIGVDQES